MYAVKGQNELVLRDPLVSDDIGKGVCVGYGDGGILPRWRVLGSL